jgi:hypothetical protein
MIDRSAFAAIAVTVALSMGVAGAQAQVQDLSKYPDWSGQWRKPAGIGNGPWDVAKPAGRAQQAPLTPEYQAIYDAKLAERATGSLAGDPTAQCIPHGMPRMMVAIYPMEIIVTPKTTYVLSDYNEPRRIYTDGRSWPKEIEPTFLGYSIGKWIDENGDGRYNLLDVETRSFKGPRTFDGSGIPLHEDGQTIIKERIYLDKADKDLLHIEITTIDNALTRPWAVVRPYRRDHNPIWMYVDCSENNHQIFIGKDSYMLSGDGRLMPTKKGQAPPDLYYFEQTRK